MAKRYRSLIQGFRGSPNNKVEIAGKTLSYRNWRTVEWEFDDETRELTVCDVHIGDPDGGGKVFEEVNIHASFARMVDFAGCRVKGVGHDDS